MRPPRPRGGYALLRAHSDVRSRPVSPAPPPGRSRRPRSRPGRGPARRGGACALCPSAPPARPRGPGCGPARHDAQRAAVSLPRARLPAASGSGRPQQGTGGSAAVGCLGGGEGSRVFPAAAAAAWPGLARPRCGGSGSAPGRFPAAAGAGLLLAAPPQRPWPGLGRGPGSAAALESIWYFSLERAAVIALPALPAPAVPPVQRWRLSPWNYCVQLMLYVLGLHLWRGFENTSYLEAFLGKQTWTKVALRNVSLCMLQFFCFCFSCGFVTPQFFNAASCC